MNTQGENAATQRTLTGALLILAMSGWGAFAYACLANARPEPAQHSQTARSEPDPTEISAAQNRGKALVSTPAPTDVSVDPPAAAVTGSVQTAAFEVPTEQGAEPVAPVTPATPQLSRLLRSSLRRSRP